MWTRLWERKLEGRGKVRGIKLHPGAATALLPPPIQQWSDKRTPLHEVVPYSPEVRHAVLGEALDPALSSLADFVRNRAKTEEETTRARNIVSYVKDHPRLTKVEVLADEFVMYLLVLVMILFVMFVV